MYDLHHKVNPKEVIVGWLVHYYLILDYFSFETENIVFQGTQQDPISTLIQLLFKISILKKQPLIKRYTLLYTLALRKVKNLVSRRLLGTF